MSAITYSTAFAAGLVSFLSPCVLPVVPGYLSFLSGVSLDQLREGSASKGRILASSLAFVAGFAAVFTALGASATAIGQLLMQHQTLFSRLAGLVIVILGLHMLGVFKLSWLYQEKRVQVQRRPVGLPGAALVGVAFAFGWTPCIGPILAGILGLASTQESLPQGVGLLATYSLGLGLPFVLAGLGFERFMKVADRFKQHMRSIEMGSGALLVAIGVLIGTGGLARLSGYLGFLGAFAL